MIKRSKYPFATLEVGQEHFIQLGEEETISELRSRVSASASIYSRGRDIKFSVKTQPDGIKLIRIK